MKRCITVIFLGACSSLAMAADATWPQFRGPGGAGVSNVALPDKFDPQTSVRWKAALPGRGLSCPVVAGGKVFVTANTGMDQTRLHVLGFDLKTGKKLWERQFAATGQTLCHPTTCMACPTIATDGKDVFALFATGDLFGLTAEGDVKWVRSLLGEYPKMVNHVGRSSSPVLANGVLVVLQENQGESCLLGVDPQTGANRWKVERPNGINWNTPLVMQRGGMTEVVVASLEDMAAFDPVNGKMIWSLNEKFHPIVSPVAAGDKILAPGKGGLNAIKPSSGGAVGVEWHSAKLNSGTPTGVVAGGKFYTIAGGQAQVLKCGDLEKGEEIWSLRVPGPFSASPLYADGKVYLFNEKGQVIVVQPGAEPKIVATNEFNEKFQATPAIADGALFLRSDQHLWCIEGTGKSGS